MNPENFLLSEAKTHQIIQTHTGLNSSQRCCLKWDKTYFPLCIFLYFFRSSKNGGSAHTQAGARADKLSCEAAKCTFPLKCILMMCSLTIVNAVVSALLTSLSSVKFVIVNQFRCGFYRHHEMCLCNTHTHTLSGP